MLHHSLVVSLKGRIPFNYEPKVGAVKHVEARQILKPAIRYHMVYCYYLLLIVLHILSGLVGVVKHLAGVVFEAATSNLWSI